MKRLAITFWTVVVVCAAVSAPAPGAIVYSGSQNVTLALGPMSPMASKTIQLGGMSEAWDDFRVDLWLDMGMPGSMMMGMGMGTKLAIYAPRSVGMSMGTGMGMTMGMGGVLGMQDYATNLNLGGMIGPDTSFLDWAYLYGSGQFGEDGGYVGLRTAMGNFGWLHVLSQSDLGTDSHRVTIDGWAYEDLPGVAVAAGEGGPCDWRPGSPYKMHWPQLPDLGFTGIDIALTQMTLADDFQCTATGPIRDIHIWGSFNKDILPKEGPGGLTFEVSIYSDVPAADKLASHPGNRLWTKTLKPGEYTVRQVHDGPEDWYDPAKGQYAPANHRLAFQYNFCIDKDPFTQEEGKIYWLAVRESSAATNYTFGWKTTAQQFRWNDDAVYFQSKPTDWADMGYPKGHKYGGQSLDLAFVITDGSQLATTRDLGDAPDSSNSVAAPMLAYPGVVAHFPTVYHAGSPPYGPMHLYPRDMFYLGNWVSLESEADIGMDDDGFANIDPLDDIANRDGGDDGLKLPVSMPLCESTTLTYTVTVTSATAKEAYVNVWCDWNRDGDWDDTMLCPDGGQAVEWAVQNDKLTFAGPGVYTFSTSSFKCWHPVKDEIDPLWVRITIAEQQHFPTYIVPLGAPGVEGAGPKDGYKYGETEDYLIRPVSEPAVKYDWGDAPVTAGTVGYPTLAADNGARHVPAGPWLGDEKDVPDTEADGQPQADALGDDNNGSDDENGVSLPPLIQGQPAAATVEVNGGGGVLQAWIDFSGDHTWQSSEKIFDAFLPDGVHTINFTTPDTAVPGKTFARFRISRQGGLGPAGPAPDGEVEDYEVMIDTAPATVKKWCQPPELTPEGIDVRIDNGENVPRTAADDFECRQPGKLTHIRLWGSWKNDKKGQIKKLHLRIHPDDPVGLDGADTRNKYSKPGPETLWEGEFLAGQFTEKLYSTVEIAGEWWWDPAVGDAIPGGDKQVWQLDIDVAADKTFLQEGSSEAPRIYWLEVAAETADGQLGWKTRRWPDHFMDDAVFNPSPKTSLMWDELFYPHGHKYYAAERNSIDMAFCLLFTVDSSQPTSQALSPTQCPVVRTTCPTTVTECPATRTTCPAVETSCPATDTQCPAVQTQCPPATTKCPPTATECQTVQTQCPVAETRCPATDTKCPATQTQCPASPTKCPPTATACQVVRTQCPAVETECPATDTKCPAVQTQCPPATTKCPATATECQVVQTQCPAVETRCPASPTKCPVVKTRCGSCLNLAQGQASAGDALLLGFGCPAVETDCPTVDQYLAIAQGAK